MKTTIVILCSFMAAWILRDPRISDALDNVYAWATKDTVDLENTIITQQDQINSLTLALEQANEQIEDQKVQISYYKIRVLKRGIDPKLAKVIATSTHLSAQRFGIDPDMILGIVRVESNFDPLAISPTNAKGLTQIIEHYWAKDCRASGNKLFEVAVNINCGALVFATERKKFNNDTLSLMAYNMGPSAVKKMLDGKIRMNTGYASAVQRIVRQLKSEHLNDESNNNIASIAF